MQRKNHKGTLNRDRKNRKKNRKCLLTLELKQFRSQLKGKNSAEKIAESTYMREKEMLT